MTYHLEDQLSAYMDDELSDEERQQVEAHLEICESCQVLLEELLSIQSNVMHTFIMIQEPVDLEIRVLQAIADRTEPAATAKGWILVTLMAFMASGILWFLTGPVLVKLIHGVLKLMIALVYMASHFVTGVPVLSGLTVVLSLIIITTSIFSLRRLLQTPAS
jgi:predicted anti-sigma-YlaC factor YlaD